MISASRTGMNAGLPSDVLRAIARDLALTDGRIADEVAVVADSAAELRRQHLASDKRRGGPGSDDARKYALGSVLTVVGMEGIDDTALLGLFAHPDLMMTWMRAAMAAGAGPMLGDIVRSILADPIRLTWCRQWGRILQWRRLKALYTQEVERFLSTGPIDPHASWRRKPISIGQQALIAKLCELLRVHDPNLKDRGEAFEWLQMHGGNPSYWHEPPLPPNMDENNA